MRVLSVVLLLAFAGFTLAQDKKDKKDEKFDAETLLGKWERTEAPDDKALKIVIEFADKGKATMTMNLAKYTVKAEGTYKLDGNKLELTLTNAGKEQKDTFTITKLTGDELVTSDSKGKEDTFKRIKPKK